METRRANPNLLKYKDACPISFLQQRELLAFYPPNFCLCCLNRCMYGRHYEVCCLKLNQRIVTAQQRRFALGTILRVAEWRWCTAAGSSVSAAHASTKLLSGVSNGSVWAREGKRAQQLRSFCQLGAERVGIVWEVPHLWKFSYAVNWWLLMSTFTQKCV